jgi:hypothetical protein
VRTTSLGPPATDSGLQPRLRDEITGYSLDPDTPLLWRRTVPLAQEFELIQSGTVFGEMEPANRPGVDATGECLGRSLELCREVGFGRGILVETRPPSGGPAGPRFQGFFPGWGRIVTPQGETLRWRHALTRMYDHILTDSRGVELFRLQPPFLRLVRTETRVVVRASGWERPDLAELLLLTWFLRIHSETPGRAAFKRAKRQPGEGVA